MKSASLLARLFRRHCASRTGVPASRVGYEYSIKPRLERLENRLALTAGLLDSSFDGDGFAQTAFSTGQDAGWAVVVQPDGKTVVGGYTSRNGYQDLAFARYNVNGSLDNKFGAGGKVTVHLGNMDATVTALAIQPDGKIVGAAAGQGRVQVPAGGFPDYATVVRLNANGSLDTTFGDASGRKSLGYVLTQLPPSGNIPATSIDLQSDGKIIVGGAYFSGVGPAKTYNDFAVLRYTAAGRLDSSFGSGGIVTTDFGGGGSSSDQVYGIAIQSDGKIVAAGAAGTTNPNGSTSADFGIARYNTNGTLDATFGNGGKASYDLDNQGVGSFATAVHLQPLANGSFRIAVSGNATLTGQTKQMTVAAITPAGNLDATFGTGGVVTTPTFQLSSGLSGTLRYAPSFAIQADNKLVVGVQGVTTNFNNNGVGFGLVRYTPDGMLDTAFGDNGVTFTDQYNGKPILLANYSSTSIGSDGRIVQVGLISTTPDPAVPIFGNTTGWDFLTARYTADSANAASANASAIDAALMLLMADDPLTTKRK